MDQPAPRTEDATRRQARVRRRRSHSHEGRRQMLVTDGGAGQTVEDVLRALGAALDERHARGVVLIEVPDGVVVRARASTTAGGPPDGPLVSVEQAFGHKEILERRMAALHLRGTGHRAGRLERALRVLGRYIDVHDLHQVTLMERDAERGWRLWHRSPAAGRHLPLTFDTDELERAARAAQAARDALPVPVAAPDPDPAAPTLLASTPA